MTYSHAPVMVAEVLAHLKPKAGGVYVDGTFGGGGYTQAVLATPATTVLAIDKDPAAAARAQALQSTFGPRLKFYQGSFAELDSALVAHQLTGVDGLMFDLGLSSYQLDDPQRGFSFSHDGPLDMRMGNTGPTAADLVNTLSEQDLANLFWRYGEEKNSKKIARAIAAQRRLALFMRTGELASCVANVSARGRAKIHPATRVFQALRIAVNQELADLETVLPKATAALLPEGRLVVVSFHSLEDRPVKEHFRQLVGPRTHHNKYQQANARDVTTAAPCFIELTRKPIVPSKAECAQNPRARSAKLRALQKVQPC